MLMNSQMKNSKAKARKGRPIVCIETGEVFPSAQAAAQSLGISYGASNIGTAARNGGAIKGFHWRFKDDPEPEPGQIRGNRAVVCWETGEEFDTAEEAAVWAGTDIKGIYASLNLHCSSGGFHWYLKGTPKPDAGMFKTGKAVVCWETGEVFESVNAAAKAAGLKNGGRISTAAKNGGMSGGCHWYFEGSPKPDASDLIWPNQHRPGRKVVCWETGKVYTSIREAASAVGVADSKNVAIAARTGGKSGGFHWHFEGEDGPKKKEKKRKTRAVVCWETGEKFESISAASAAVGLKSESSIRSVLRGEQITAGGFHWYLSDQPKPVTFEYEPRRKQPIACWETDEVFEGADEAAAAVGLKSKSNIYSAVRKGVRAGGYHWYRLDRPKPKKSELKQDKRRNRRKTM